MANLLYFAALIIFYLTHLVKAKEMVVKSVTKCPVENPIEMEIELVNLDDGLAMNMNATYDYDIDDNYMLQTTFYKMKNGNWERSSFYEDRWCAVMVNIAKPWNLAKAQIQPPLPDGCVIPAGDYKLKEFQLKEEDVASTVAQVEPGKYKSDVVLVTSMQPDKEEVLCVTVEFDVQM